MKKTNGALSAVAGFLKRNAVYLILSLCIVAIGVSVALIMAGEKNSLIINEDINDPGEILIPTEEPTIEDPVPTIEPEPIADTPTVKIVSFCMPVESYTSIGEYSETMVFNSTLKRYSAHKAMDFYGEEGAKVYCVYDGVIKSVDSTLLTGVTVTVDHGDGLITVYNSLLDAEGLLIGQKVSQGDVLGVISTSNRQEYKEGAHLHFETFENGVSINPEKYLSIDSK